MYDPQDVLDVQTSTQTLAHEVQPELVVQVRVVVAVQ
jgi:hypothetical protein